jgi:ribosomal protein L24E
VKRSAVHALIAAALIATAGIGSALVGPTAAGADAAAPRATAVAISSRNVDFGYQRVGTVGRLLGVKIRNSGTTPLTLNRISFQSGNRTDFIVGTGCFPSGLHKPVTLAPGASCTVAARFAPRARTTRVAILRIDDSASTSPQFVRLRGVGTQGYYLAGVQGGIATFGDARYHGDPLNYTLAAPIISLTITPNGAGYWLLGTDGGIFSFGNAKFFGSTGGMRLAAPALGMAPTPNGRGYWLVAGDGGIFSFGNAKFFGSTGAMRLNQPVVGMAATPSGKGYWLVARDGGIFTFGDAKFFGSTGGLRLNQPVVGMSSTPSGKGYWLVAGDGGIFTFGDARYFGSTGGGAFGVMTGMAITSDGGGYWLSNTAGQVFPFGNAPYYGDIYRRHRSVLAAVAASAPKLRPPGFAGTALYLRHGSQNAAMLPHAVPRLDGG